ncbi:hypothetical protein N7448_011381 [Penicillium atrosanguineum]|nr:hypothetical protein N7448_011381 [Penicillium atrosanguineum]
MAFPASIPELSERADPCAYHNTSFNVFAYGQRALNDGVNRVDRALTFWYSEALDWHFHLFSELNQKPLPFSVAARLSIEEPGGETSDKTLPNRFRVTGTVTVPQRNCHLLRYGNRIPILGWEIRLSATDSVKIFSVIASTDDNAEALAEPESVPLHTTAYQSLQDDKVTLPVSWESLQFQLPTHNSENNRNPVRSFFVRLQVVATVFFSQPDHYLASQGWALCDSTRQQVPSASPTGRAARRD